MFSLFDHRSTKFQKLFKKDSKGIKMKRISPGEDYGNECWLSFFAIDSKNFEVFRLINHVADKWCFLKEKSFLTWKFCHQKAQTTTKLKTQIMNCLPIYRIYINLVCQNCSYSWPYLPCEDNLAMIDDYS